MSTIKEAPGPRISPYLQCLYGLFNLLLLAVMIISFLSVSGNFSKSTGVQSSNATHSKPSQLLEDVIATTHVPNPVENLDRSSPCSMDACFNYSRCDNMEEVLVYHYDANHSTAWCFMDALKRSPFYTSDPQKACLFLVTIDSRLSSPPLSSLPYWNHGLNHVVISILDKSRNPKVESTGLASTMTSITHQTTYRAGFDISVPLPQKKFYPNIQGLKALDRKYFLTFKGTRYLEDKVGRGGFRNNPILRRMHNGEDIIVATTCKQDANNEILLRRPELNANCAKDQSIYNQYKFDDLMNSTFGLAPAGRGPSSLRLLEVLSAGSIPVAISDNFVLPFDTLIEWRRCLFVFPTSQMHRIVPTLRSLNRDEIEFRRESCLFIYCEFLESNDKIVATTAMALKSRFFGVLPKLIPKVPLPPRHLSLKQQPHLKSLKPSKLSVGL